MSNMMKLVTSEKFDNTLCDFYQNVSGETYLTREQIGTALGYADPIRGLQKLHASHRQRLDPLCVKVSEFHPAPKGGGVTTETTYYSERGIMEICRWSDMPKADEFMDWCFDIVEAYRHGQLIAMNAQIADLIEKVGVITDQFNVMNNQLEATQTKVAVMQKEVETTRNKVATLQNDHILLSETSVKLDNRLAMVESGVSVSNGKLSKWVQETSKDVLELAEADGCKPKEMYSKIIDEMCEVGGYNWEEIYKQYCECHPDEKSPWRIVVIEYFNLCELFEDTLVRFGYDILPSKYERPTYGMGSDWMVGCEF